MSCTHCVEQGKSVVIFLLFSQPTPECCSNIVLSLACCLTGGRELGAVQEQLWYRHRPRPDHVHRQQYYCPDPWTLLAHSSLAQAQCFVRPFCLPILQLIEWSLAVDPGPNTESLQICVLLEKSLGRCGEEQHGSCWIQERLPWWIPTPAHRALKASESVLHNLHARLWWAPFFGEHQSLLAGSMSASSTVWILQKYGKRCDCVRSYCTFQKMVRVEADLDLYQSFVLR